MEVLVGQHLTLMHQLAKIVLKLLLSLMCHQEQLFNFSIELQQLVILIQEVTQHQVQQVELQVVLFIQK